MGAGVPLADLRKLYDSLLAPGDRQLADGELAGAELAFEQALALCRTHHRAIALGGVVGGGGSSAAGGAHGETNADVANAAAVAVSDCLSRPRRGAPAERRSDGRRGAHRGRHRRPHGRCACRRPRPLQRAGAALTDELPRTHALPQLGDGKARRRRRREEASRVGARRAARQTKTRRT